MKFKLFVLGCVICFLPWQSAFAQTSLDDQINSVYAVQLQQQAVAAKAASDAAASRAAADADARRVEKRREAAMEAARQKREASVTAEKQRNDGYTDQLRSLEIQRQQLHIQAEKNLVDRQNDYINQDLQQSAAETDVIRSNAEANRNISQGAKTYLEHAGAAASATTDTSQSSK